MLDHTRFNIPKDAVPIAGLTTAITGTTPVVAIAAPAAGKALYITQLYVMNPTTAEIEVYVWEDTTGTPIPIIRVQSGHLAATTVNGDEVLNFDPPLKLATAKGLNCRAAGATGDAFAFANGYVGTVPSSDVSP